MKLSCPICQRDFHASTKRGVNPHRATCSFRCREEQRRRKIETDLSETLGQSLADYLRRRYEEGATLVQLGQEVGRDGTQLLRTWFRRYQISTRRPKSGNVPGGITDNRSPAFARNQERMTSHNPSRDTECRSCISASQALYWRKEPTAKEQEVLSALTQAGVEFIFQHPIGNYVADFWFPQAQLILEVTKWLPPDRLARDHIRDQHLSELGFRILHIAYRRTTGRTAAAALHGLADLNLVIRKEIACPRPTPCRQDRML